MAGYVTFAILVWTSVIMPEGLWGVDRGWQTHRVCRDFIKDSGRCRKLAEDTFRARFPALSFEWPTCGKDDVIEAILWAAVADRNSVDRYLRMLSSLCASGR